MEDGSQLQINRLFHFLWPSHYQCISFVLDSASPQHGKDFEAIQNNIALKYKKKGKPASMVKNKEQVRHFYYRTWHKISKHIDFNNGEVAPYYVMLYEIF